MKNTAIIIPTRLGAKRFPNKPLAKINGVPMIIHVLNRAQESNVGEVVVATPDNEIFQVVKKNGGRAILTKIEHSSGTDRVYEAYIKALKNKVDFLINLQGDLPNIKSSCIKKLVKLMRNNDCDIGTLASPIVNKNEMTDMNVVKVEMEEILKGDDFLKAKDFFRIKKDSNNEKIYHHIGIYAFTNTALTKYVKLPRSYLELERNLEQLRAMQNNMVIKVGLSDSIPLSVDSETDLFNIENVMQ